MSVGALITNHALSTMNVSYLQQWSRDARFVVIYYICVGISFDRDELQPTALCRLDHSGHLRHRLNSRATLYVNVG